MSTCHCRKCRDASGANTWWMTPSQLQELLLSGACPTCGTFTCPHALNHEAMCPGPNPNAPEVVPGVGIQWFTFLDGTYTVDPDES